MEFRLVHNQKEKCCFPFALIPNGFHFIVKQIKIFQRNLNSLSIWKVEEQNWLFWILDLDFIV